MHQSIIYLFVAASIGRVTASLYPIQPVQSTVYSAGEPVLVKWIEDSAAPSIHDMGPMEIQLWSVTTDTNQTYITTLDTDVNPLAKSTYVTIPPDLVYDGPNFAMRFFTRIPAPLIIYTAQFSITNSSSTSSWTGTPTSSHTATAAIEAGVWPDASTTSMSSTSASTPTVTAPPIRPIPSQPLGVQQQQQKSSSTQVDVEKIKFRLVFILWPAMIGIIMSL